MDDLKIKACELIASGEKNYIEIAGELNITRRTLYSWRQDPEFIKMLKELESESIEEAKTFLKLNASKAARELVKAMKSENSKVALDACKDILDRSGMSVNLGIKLGLNVAPEESERINPDDIRRRIEERKKLNE